MSNSEQDQPLTDHEHRVLDELHKILSTLQAINVDLEETMELINHAVGKENEQGRDLEALTRTTLATLQDLMSKLQEG